MKIAIISYQGYEGAGVKHAHFFANQMVDLGHEVLFLLTGHARSIRLMAEAPRYEVQEISFSNGLLDERTLRVAATFDPEILHLWTPRHIPARVGLAVWEATHARLVIHYEDDEQHILEHIGTNQEFASSDAGLYRFFSGEHCDPEELDFWVDDIKYDYLRRTFYEPRCWQWIHPVFTPLVEKLADGFTSISPSYLRLLQKHLGKSGRMLYPGVDFDTFAPQEKPRDLVEKYGIEGRLVLLYSGTIADFHDFTDVMRVLRPVVDQHPDVLLMQVGGNEISYETGRIAEDERITRHVLFTGLVPHREMHRHLALADAFIGSVRLDVFNGHRLPSKIPEYMAMGRPMLIMDHGIGQELDEGSEVVKVREDVGRGLQELLARRDSWPQMGDRLRQKAKELFDWRHNTERLLSYYRELLDAPAVEAREGLNGPSAFVSLAQLGYQQPSPHPVNDGEARQRFVILTDGLIGAKMSGTGIRYLEMARALSRHFDVALGQKFAIDEPTEELEELEFFRWHPDRPRELPAQVMEADFVLIHGWLLEKLPGLRDVPGRLIVDLYCPFIFENIEIFRDRGSTLHEQDHYHEASLKVLHDQIVAGDYFLCCTERQRDWILGLLTSLGGIRPGHTAISPDELIGLVPFGLPEEPPERRSEPVMKGVWPGIAEGDIVLLWGGGLWSWLDPLVLIQAMATVAQERSDVKLVFLSTQTAENVIDMPIRQRCFELADQLGLTGSSVIFNTSTYIDYAERGQYFYESDIGVCAHTQTLETHFAFRTRILDYLNVGLPILTSAGDFFAELVDRERLGRSVAIGDAGAWATAILELANDPEARARCADRVQAKRGDFTWTKVTAPIVEYCQRPRDPRAEARIAAMRGQIEEPRALAAEMLRSSADQLLTRTLDQIASMRSTYVDVKRYTQSLEGELQQADAANSDSVAYRTSLEGDLETVREQVDELSGYVGHLEKELADKAGHYAELEKIFWQHAELRDSFAELENKHRLLAGHAARMEEKLGMLRKIPLVRNVWRLLGS